jgi:hypothetical protein
MGRNHDVRFGLSRGGARRVKRLLGAILDAAVSNWA